jgi:vitamin B12 transporter
MYRTALFLSAALAAPLAVPVAAQAQTAGAGPLSEVVITSRTPMAASPYSTTVIGQARLATANGVADALSDVADIYIQAPGARSGFGSLFLRGADPNFTTVLLDGVPLNNPTNTRGGAVNISEISAAGLDRVEVVADPLSGLYGSGSLAGAVNMIVGGGTPDPSGRVAVGLGTQGDYTGAVTLRGPVGGRYGGAVTFDAADDGDMAGGGQSFQAQTLTGKIAPLDGEGARIVFRLMTTKADTFPDNSGGPTYATLRETDRREGREGLVGVVAPVLVRDGFRIDVSASVLDRRDEVTGPGVAPSVFDDFGVPAGGDVTHYRRWIAGATARFDNGPWSAVAGLEAQDERARDRGELVFFGFPTPTNFAGDRTTVSGFGEAAWSNDALTVNGGLRVDDVDGVGTHVTGRVGARYAFAGTGFAVRANAGTGFKAPSFYALGNPFVGNPDLKPEKSESGEVAVEWTGQRAAVSVAAFHNRFKNLIDFLPGPVPGLANRGVVISEGVSGRASWRWTDTLSSAWQVQYAETTDDDTGQDLLNRPNWRLTSALTWTPRDTVSFILRTGYVGERNDYSTPTGPRTLDSYRLVAVEGAWTFAPQTAARVIVDNALDDNYESAIGFRGPGARARLILSREF